MKSDVSGGHVRLPSMGWGEVAPQSAAQAKHSSQQQARCQSRGDPLALSRLGVSTIARVGKSGANMWRTGVELLAATAILSLSVGCGLAAARAALEALFSLMTVYTFPGRLAGHTCDGVSQ